jgi:hypothetical protein
VKKLADASFFYTQAASSDNTPEDEDFVDCSRNNNSTETKQTDSLDNEETEDKTAKHNNNLNVS